MEGEHKLENSILTEASSNLAILDGDSSKLSSGVGPRILFSEGRFDGRLASEENSAPFVGMDFIRMF